MHLLVVCVSSCSSVICCGIVLSIGSSSQEGEGSSKEGPEEGEEGFERSMQSWFFIFSPSVLSPFLIMLFPSFRPQSSPHSSPSSTFLSLLPSFIPLFFYCLSPFFLLLLTRHTFLSFHTSFIQLLLFLSPSLS